MEKKGSLPSADPAMKMVIGNRRQKHLQPLQLFADHCMSVASESQGKN